MKYPKTFLAFLSAAVIVAPAVYLLSRDTQRMPPTLRDALNNNDLNGDIESLLKKAEKGTKKEDNINGIVLGAESGNMAGEPSKPVEFVLIEGGKFMMGTDKLSREMPIHEVTIKTFEMAKTLVTVEQYGECVVKGKCRTPGMRREPCNWGKKDRQHHPVNCINLKDATDFAKFKAARLPSEAEYEYAATSRGKYKFYPWGEDRATCDRVVFREDKGVPGCGHGSTMPVCSKPLGNTEQGLCDMIGNVWEIVPDAWHESYVGAPTDGSVWEGQGALKVVRGGGSYDSTGGIAGWLMRANSRDASDESDDNDSRDYNDSMGFRLAR